MALVNSSMAESASKGKKSLELNDSDAAVRKTRRFSHVSVVGYDSSLQKYAIQLTLIKCFASCGKMLSISVDVLKSVALIKFEGEGARKALELSGTDVGGWIPILKPVKAKPGQSKPFVPYYQRIKGCSILVEGYDTGLPEIDIQIALCKHFSSCGEVTKVIFPDSGCAYITMDGESCEEKALELSGRAVGGMTLVVDHPKLRPASPGDREKIIFKSYGYTPPSRKLELEERKKKKKKM